jgi:hypothetical protein
MAVVIGAGGGAVFFQNDTTVTADTTVDTSKNWASVGPITIQSGVTVTINSGATWAVL